MTVGISGALLLFFCLLFAIEARRGERVLLRRLRSWLDQVVLKVFYFITHIKVHFGAGAIRIFLHFCVHKVLAALLYLLTLFEKYVELLQRQNRTVAKTVRKEQEMTHLDVIAEHKASVSLTETEKQKLKKRSLEEHS